MLINAQNKQVRININLRTTTRNKLAEIASSQGKKLSALVRESIEEKISRTEKQAFEEKMKTAYQEMAEENAMITKDFQYADAENLP
jgi:hypothetical protein